MPHLPREHGPVTGLTGVGDLLSLEAVDPPAQQILQQLRDLLRGVNVPRLEFARAAVAIDQAA
jgi:hypothetical protein